MLDVDGLTKKLVKVMWDDICGRSGLDLGCFDKEVQKEIKTEWYEAIKKVLEKANKDLWKT